MARRSGGICAKGHGFYSGSGCPKCRQERAVSPVLNFNHSGDPQYMDPETVAFHMEHTRECERQIAAGNADRYRPGKNRHFRANVPKRVY